MNVPGEKHDNQIETEIVDGYVSRPGSWWRHKFEDFFSEMFGERTKDFAGIEDQTEEKQLDVLLCLVVRQL